MTNLSDDTPQSEESYEQSHVHSVYNSIASHFSQTRYKPWPIVEQFLKDLIPSSVGVDVGCGNGKYLALRDDVFILGSDRSDQLVDIAKQHSRHDVLVGDALRPPHPHGRFDFAISIAVLHHLSTRERRVEGVRVLLQMLKTGRETNNTQPGVNGSNDRKSIRVPRTPGQALIFVWALEQKNSRRGWDEGGEQDVLVPWVLKSSAESSRQAQGSSTKVKVGKKKNPVVKGDTKMEQGRAEIKSGDKATTAAIQENLIHDHAESLSDPMGDKHTATGTQTNQDNDSSKSGQVYQRYYHLYRKGELEEDVIYAGGEVVNSGYDRDNWWCIARRKV